MKLPLDDSVGGGDGNRDPAPASSDESSSRGGGGGGVGVGGEVQVQPNGQAAANGSGGPSDPDFSEYLWMEHEDEFDQEVLRELEDEEMLHYYYDLYEASVEEEAKRNSSSSSSNNNDSHPNSSSSHHHHRQAPSAAHETPNCSIRIPGPTPPFNRAPRSNYQNDGLGEITRGLDRVSFSSRLNPNAAEFVPRGVERGSRLDCEINK